MHRETLRLEAIALRKMGYSYPYISNKIGISKSTLSDWLTDVPYIPNQEMCNSLGKARAAANERKVQIRQSEMDLIREIAKAEIGSLTERDLLMFGLGLYLGEGAKTHGIVRVVNSDPRVIKCAVAWFLALGVTREQFSARIFIYPDNNPKESMEFWSKITGIPASQFQKTYIDIRTDKKKKKLGKLPFGTFHLSVRSGGRKEFGVLFSRKIQALNEAVLQRI